MEFEILTNHQIQQHIETIASLRIAIFKEYPYLYDGDMQSERDYLKSYAASKNSVVILAKDKGKIVGAVTGIPLSELDKIFLMPFMEKHIPTKAQYYLGEILLLKEYRGKGNGYKLYSMFEEWVRQKGKYQKIVIAEVVRPANDPRKPKDYIPTRKFWESLGYIEHPELVFHIPYKEIGYKEKVPHSLVFSFKDLSSHPK